ncbi:MAG: hypothetical protein ABI856_05970 [Nitrospira sp.]
MSVTIGGAKTAAAHGVTDLYRADSGESNPWQELFGQIASAGWGNCSRCEAVRIETMKDEVVVCKIMAHQVHSLIHERNRSDGLTWENVNVFRCTNSCSAMSSKALNKSILLRLTGHS